MSTTSVEIRHWEDDPEPGRSADEWPYPTGHVQYLIQGDLADRVRAKLGEPESSAVYLTEHSISGGYSEYTQETMMEFTLECGRRVVDFNEWSLPMVSGDTTVARLAVWLSDSNSA